MERITQTRNPIIGTNIERLCKERNMRYIDVIAKLNIKGIMVQLSRQKSEIFIMN